MYVYHFFFIHSSVNGHLGCFHVLTIVKSAAVNTGLHVSFRIRVLFTPRPELCPCPASAPSCLSKSVVLHPCHVLLPGAWDSFLTLPTLPTFSQSLVPSSLPPKCTMNSLHLHCSHALPLPRSLQVTFNFVPSCPNPFATQKAEGYLKSLSHIAFLLTLFFFKL